MEHLQEEKFRTSFRLSADVRELLRKTVALAKDQSAESIIDNCLRAGLRGITYQLGVEHPTVWGELLATRFFQFLPTPFVLKDYKTQAAIFANAAYERMFGVKNDQFRGRRVTDLPMASLRRQQIEDDIKVLARSNKKFCDEAMTLSNHRTTLFRCNRFLFSDANKSRLVGDYTFPLVRLFDTDASADEEELQLPTQEELRGAVLRSSIPEAIRALFIPALQSTPMSVVIKDAKSTRLVWHNNEFLELARAKCKPPNNGTFCGMTTQEIWDLRPHDPIVVNDLTVYQRNEAAYFEEQLPGAKPRISLRFPIPGDDPNHPMFIGVVSPHVEQQGTSEVFDNPPKKSAHKRPALLSDEAR